MAHEDLPLVLFSGTSHPIFTEQLAQFLGVSLGRVSFDPFPDGEIYMQILDNVRGRDVFVVQSVARHPNTYLMELLIMIDALKRASAKSIVAVIPYFGYARQDRKDKPRVPITGKLVADLLTTAGASRVLTMDLHAGQIQGFFNIPVDNLYARPKIAEAILELGLENIVITAPDLGAIKQARAYANHLGADFAVIDKRRVSSLEVEVSSIIGEVKNKIVILVDDMCSTGGTLISGAEAVLKAGAQTVYAAFTHALLVKDAIPNLLKSPIEKIITTDSIPLTNEIEGFFSEKFKIVSTVPLFGESISRIMYGASISSLFN